MNPLTKFNTVFKTNKPVIAMAHLLPLPGSPLYDAGRGVGGIITEVRRDLEALQQGGVDAIMFGNEGDRPYLTKASPESLAAMAVIVAKALDQVVVPFGVNYLWDPVASVALAHATGAKFVREVFTGAYDSDMGFWVPDAASAVRLRRNLEGDFLHFYNINAEFASPVGNRSLASKAQSAVFASLADAICVSGPMTGLPVNLSDLADVKKAVPDVPVIANTGVTKENVNEILTLADAVIVGTSLKIDGNTWKAVDPKRVSEFMSVVRANR
jgi:uncharacterized protein